MNTEMATDEPKKSAEQSLPSQPPQKEPTRLTHYRLPACLTQAADFGS